MDKEAFNKANDEMLTLWEKQAASWNVRDSKEAKIVFNALRDAVAKGPLHFYNDSVEHFPNMRVKMTFKGKNGELEMVWKLPYEMADDIVRTW